MSWIGRNIRWIMILSGALTATMIYAAIAPDAAMRSMFGETVDGPLAHLLARNWGALIALTGGLLIYGALDPAARTAALVTASASKIFFIALVVSERERFAGQQVILGAAADAAMVLLFLWYLASRPRA